jgi:hypothetical protein
VEATTNAVLLEDKEALDLVARNFIDQWIAQKRERGSMRPGRRLPLIDAALQTLEDIPPRDPAPAAQRARADDRHGSGDLHARCMRSLGR